MAAQLGEPRTNNLCEAWHRRFNDAVGKSHPSLYTLLREFQREQAATETKLRDLELGRPIKEPQRKKYRDVTDRLKSISVRYDEYKQNGREQRLRYLRLCGATFTL